MEITANSLRPWTPEEKISLHYIQRTIPEVHLRSYGFFDFVDYFQTLPQRTLRFEAVCQTVLTLHKLQVPAVSIRSVLQAIPVLVASSLYDILIEEYLEGARIFPRIHKGTGLEVLLFPAYCAPRVIKNRKLFEALTVFVRHYSNIFMGEIKKPSPQSPLLQAMAALFKVIPEARTEQELQALYRLLDLAVDFSSLAIVTGKTLSRGDIRAIRQFVSWVQQIPPLPALVQSSQQLAHMHGQTWSRLKAGHISGLGELWKNPLIGS